MHLGLCEQLGVCRFTGYKFCIQEAQSVVVETGIKIDRFSRCTRLDTSRMG